ncbi:MAG: M48 family metallopeptidase, partial [Leptospiraceae bacterium]|nr:M48 family metallopeptidase [Leptospiraceae bacterium]
NLRLILAPQWIIDYVIVHELCHLTHANHSSEFWSLVGSVYSDFRKARKWLRQNGHTLLLTGEDKI